MNSPRFRPITIATVLALVAAVAWLHAQTIHRQQTSSPTRNFALTVTGNPAPIGTVTIEPTIILVNTPTLITVTTQLSGSFIPASATVIRLNAGSSTVLALLHDDGKNGDAVSGDGIYSATASLTESTPGEIALQISVAQPTSLKRILSNPLRLTVQGLNLSGLLSSTPIVAQGTLLNAVSFKTGNRIYTDVTFSTSRIIKGSLPATIVVHISGGTVSGVTQLGPISTSFQTGTELILFLDGPDNLGRLYIPDGPLGVFTVLRSQSQTLAVIDPAYKSAELAFPLDPTLLTLFDQSSAHLLTVDALIAAIQNN